MIRTTAVARPLRAGVAAASVFGVVTLAGCASAAEAETEPTTPAPSATPTASATPNAEASPSAAASDSLYTDGTYTADGSYQTPESVETISVTLTLQDDVVTAVSVTGTPESRESERYQTQFAGGISAEVVGKKIDEISVTRVAGSSLTGSGFTQAVEVIKAEAQS